jgi:hypothetical protein
LNGAHVIDSSGLRIEDNSIAHADRIERVVHIDTANFDANGWVFDRNTGGPPALTTNDVSKLATQSGTASLIDGIGPKLRLGGGRAAFKRDRNRVFLHSTISYPPTADTRSAKLAALPFAAGGVAVGQSLSNRAERRCCHRCGCLHHQAVRTWNPDTPSSADLSGTTLHITITYLV